MVPRTLAGSSEASFEDLGGILTSGHAVTFLPGDPPRQGTLVVYDLSLPSGAATPGFCDTVQVVLPHATGNGVRRRAVAARHLSVHDAITFLLGDPPDIPGAAAWAAVFAAGLGVLSRGKLYPSVTPQGWDAWQAGPLDPSERRLLSDLAGALPPPAHALWLEGSSPLRVRSPAHLVQAAWDALADVLPRTAAAAVVARAPGTPTSPAIPTSTPRATPPRRTRPQTPPDPRGRFAVADRVLSASLRPWLVDASGGLAGEKGADVALRVVLDPLRVSPWSAGDPEPHSSQGTPRGEGGAKDAAARSDGRGAGEARGDGKGFEGPTARAVIQLTSRAESSLVVDAADLYRSPAAVVSRFGDDAETDLFRTLRRAARAWVPLDPVLHERAPTGLDLDDDLLADLLAEGATILQSAGVEVLWPAEILSDGIELRGTFEPVPGVVVESGLDLKTLVEFRWQATLHGDLLSDDEIDQLAEAKRGLVRLRGHWVRADPALLERLRHRRSHKMTAAEALGMLLAGTVDHDGEPVAVVAGGPLGELAARLASVAGGPDQHLGDPPGLARGVELRPYQARGVSWLGAMTEAGLGGCLADDMGLGKTLQVIALHLHRAASGRGPTLVVCPMSLLGNWEREVRRFAPETPLRRYHGPLRTLSDLSPKEIVVTSYGVSRMDAEVLSAAGFDLVVADEAQHAKNPETATARALRTISSPARLALTGTPVENRLSELWSILDWTTPGLLGPFERFVRTVATPIERNRDPVATERLSKTIRPFLLRRRKTDPGVAPDLPPRTVSDVPVPLTSEQTTLYEAEVREALAAIENEDGFARQGLVLRLLTVLKQICNHPAQYLHQSGPLAGRSGKLAALEELVDVITAEGESVLVFSQFVECLSLIEARLAHLGVGTLFLHGKVGARRRTEMVDAFQAGRAPVLLLSLKAGGVGLNLTRATHVVHYDRWWNPAVEDQATDRAHRIGQDRPVQVHRLVTEGTLEDRIAELIERKRSLAEAVVGAGESWIGHLSNAELADLVRLGSGR